MTQLNNAIDHVVRSTPGHIAGHGTPAYQETCYDTAYFTWGATMIHLPLTANSAEKNTDAATYDKAGQLLRDTGVATSTLLDIGEESPATPHGWVLVSRPPGESLDNVPLADRDRTARDLAVALAVLHQPVDEEETFSVPLTVAPLRGDRRDSVPFTWKDKFVNIADEGHQASAWPHALVWCHGQLDTSALYVQDGTLTGITGLENYSLGDPAIDYSCFYLSFTASQRHNAGVILRAMGAKMDEDIWVRARAWAVHRIVTLLQDENPDVQQRGGLLAQHFLEHCDA